MSKTICCTLENCQFQLIWAVASDLYSQTIVNSLNKLITISRLLEDLHFYHLFFTCTISLIDVKYLYWNKIYWTLLISYSISKTVWSICLVIFSSNFLVTCKYCCDNNRIILPHCVNTSQLLAKMFSARSNIWKLFTWLLVRCLPQTFATTICNIIRGIY